MVFGESTDKNAMYTKCKKIWWTFEKNTDLRNAECPFFSNGESGSAPYVPFNFLSVPKSTRAVARENEFCAVRRRKEKRREVTKTLSSLLSGKFLEHLKFCKIRPKNLQMFGSLNFRGIMKFQFNFTLLSHWKGSLLAGVQPERGHAERVGERRRPGSAGSVG